MNECLPSETSHQIGTLCAKETRDGPDTLLFWHGRLFWCFFIPVVIVEASLLSNLRHGGGGGEGSLANSAGKQCLGQ